MKRKLLCWVILALLLFVPMMAHAATAGKFTSVEGTVDVTSPGKEARPVDLGDPLNVGDIIRTKSKAKCEVTFPDGSILRLAENSRLRVNEFAQEKGERNATLDLFRGKIQNVVTAVAGAASAQSKYEVRTSTAVCGVRGTTFFVYHQAGVTGAAFKEGTGYGYSLNRPGDVRTIHAGQSMTVSNPNVPPLIRPATALEMNQHQKDTAPSEKPKSEAKKEEEKKSESVAAKTDEGKKEELKKEEQKTRESKPVDIVAQTIETPTSAALSLLPAATELLQKVLFPPVTPTKTPDVPIKTDLALTITLSGMPAAVTNAATANFVVTTSEPATVTYTLNGAPVASPNLTNLPAGSNTFTVTATDALGNSSTKSYSWTTDYIAPTITLTGTPPAVTNASTANFTVAASETSTYTYTLNGAPVASPNLTNLPTGNNTFTVTATDAAGNVSSATASWTTVYTAPTITLSGTPAAVTNAATANFVVTTSEPATVAYTLNGAPVASPNLTNLPAGSNTFTVTATNALGNSSTKSYSWTTDYTAPVLSIAPQSASPAAGGTDAKFTLGANESVTYTSAQVIDTATNAAAGSTTIEGTSVDVTGLVSGTYTLTAQGTDPAGNPAEQSLTFTLSNHAISGFFYGCIANVTGSATGGVAGILGQDWGGWDIGMEGSGNATPNATWILSAGGGNAADGYWISIAPGTTNFSAKTLSGTSQFNYLSKTQLGYGTGTVVGNYDGLGNYLLSDIGVGSYTEKPTDFGGDWRHSTLYNDYGYVEWNNGQDDYDEGVFGFKKRPDANYDFLAIGEYYDRGYGEEGFGGPYIWSGSLVYGGRQPGNRYMEAFTGGIWKKANPGDPYGTMAGHTAALYYTEDGIVGLISGALSGGFYELQGDSLWKSGMWKVESGAEGLAAIEKSAPSEFNLQSAHVYSGSLYANTAGSFVGNTGENAGTIQGADYNGKTKFIKYFDAGSDGYKSLPFGIYNLKLGDGLNYNYYTGKPVGDSISWKAKIGSDGYFGYNSVDYGYWLADVAGAWDEYSPGAGHGTINGAMSGNYLTMNHMGTIGGPFYGLYSADLCEGTCSNYGAWIGLSVGSYQAGKPLLYANRIEGDLYQQNNATIHSDIYEKPVGGYFDTRRAETLYVKSQNPANLPQYGLQVAQREIVSYGVRSDNFDAYYPGNEALSYTSSYNVPRMSRNQISRLSVQPDLTTSPPTMPPPSEYGMANIASENSTFLNNAWPVTAPIAVGTTQYAKTFEGDYDLNVMERVLPPSPATFAASFNQTFTGIMGAYQLDGGMDSLWSTDSTHPLGLSFLGGHQEAELPLVFRLRRFFSQNYAVNGATGSATPDGGAYFGVLSGALSSDRSLAAALYGLYVSPNKDGVWEAGILKTTAPLTGSSYAGINMWEAEGRIYRIPKALNLSAPSVEAIHLVDLDASNSFINIPRGAIGDATVQAQGLYGRFDTGGPITTLAGGGFGNTISIMGLPDFGIFEMLHGGIENSYSNPGATWRMDMASTGQFGRYVRSDLTNYNDFGFWTASVNDGALSGSNKLSGTLNGYFLTYKKEGTLTGEFMGNLKPDTATTGIWQGASAGAWEKTRDVTFSSGIVGDNFRLSGNQIQGNGGPDNFYNMEQNPDGTYRWAGFRRASGSTITETEYDRQGPPGQEEYSETLWIQDNTNPSVPIYTLQEAKKLTPAEFNDAIAAGRTLYKGGPYNYAETTDNYWMNRDNQHDGIFAGFDNLWNTTGGPVTNVSLIGRYGKDDRGAPILFGGTIVSFDPMYSMNPYYNSTSNPNGSRSPIGGAYYGYLGAVFGKQTVAADWLDGLINGIYLDPSGNVGILHGKFTGSNNPQVGAWTGTGTVDGVYGLGTAGSGLTEANFANNVSVENRDYPSGGAALAATGGVIQGRAMSSSSAAISNSILTPSGSGYWGVWQSRSGGTYSGTPTAWAYSREDRTDGYRIDYRTVQMNTTESNGVKTGDVVGASALVKNSDPASTYVLAGPIKGLFDPVQFTYHMVAQGTFIETATFVNKVSSMNDAQRQAFTDATKIPAFAVGTTDLRGSGSVTGGAINMGNETDATKGILNAAFYAPSTGGKPQIWASGNVNGAYTGAPMGGGVSLSGYAPGSSTANGISANFNIQQWTGTKWGATVTSGSVPAGTSGFTYPNAASTGITFQGGAAGGINAVNGTFSGTAAGIVK